MAKLYSIYFFALCLCASQACLPEWANTCVTNDDCCSKNCLRGNPDWATGVCQPGGGGGEGGGDGGSPTVSQSEFVNAVTSNGFPYPRDDQYNGFVNGLPKGNVASKREAAMALAQLLHESAGLTAKEEIACKDSKCPGSYTGAGCEAPGQYYYGRGYIQLSWCYNYRDAGNGLGLGNLLLNNADLVASNEQYAWDTAFWFWRERVRSGPYGADVLNGLFGASTRAINGGVECNGANLDQSKARFRYYQNVYQAFGIAGQPDERGCY